MFWLQTILAGVATGCVYSLAGLGVVLTYKATGVFNFAHGAIAMIVAYVLWQLNAQWHVTLIIAAPIALFVVGPGIGLVLERFVFRPLERARASTSEKLVATLGIFLVCLGFAYAVWTGTPRNGPSIVPTDRVQIASGLSTSTDQLFQIALVVVVSVLLWALFRYTHLGVEIRAVVDRRELSELASVNANRVAGIAWALGCGLAGLTGVLFAAGNARLDPFHLTLLVIETFSIAVVARLVSLPAAVGAGILLLGVGEALLRQFNPRVLPIFHTKLPTGFTTAVDQLKPNVSVVILFVALLVLRNLDEIGEAATGRGLLSRALGHAGDIRNRRFLQRVWVVIGLVAIVLPLVLSDRQIPYAHRMLAYLIVFASIVCVTGFSGHITLGQAAFAGMGAFVSSRVITAWHVPVIVGMLIGGLAAIVLGIIAGYPALRRRGLFLGLTTLTIGLLAYSFVFASNTFAGSAGLAAKRPSAFTGRNGFYWFELAWVVLMLLLANNLRSGRLGRVLGAIRDSETAAKSVGINLRTYKLFIFGASAFIAGIGGALLTQEAGAFSFGLFDPFSSLRWFMIVIVAGAGSLSGAVVGAVAFIGLNAAVGKEGVSDIIIAIAALGIGSLPGGSLVGLLRRATSRVRTPTNLMRTFDEARTQVPPPSTNGLRPSPFAEQLLAERREKLRA